MIAVIRTPLVFEGIGLSGHDAGVGTPAAVGAREGPSPAARRVDDTLSEANFNQ